MKLFYKLLLVKLFVSVGVLLAQPATTTPADAATGVSQGLTTITWADFDEGAFGDGPYDAEFHGTDNTYGGVPTSTASGVVLGVTGLDISGETLDYNTTYYWRVRDTDTDGGGTDGTWYNYSFKVVIATPTLTAPADLDDPVTLDPTYTWTMDDDKSNIEYDVEVGTTSGGPYTTLNGTAIGPGTFTYTDGSNLTPGTTYYWVVTATVNDGSASNDGETTTSTQFEFTTATALAAPSGTVSPADDGTGVSLTPTISWGTTGGGTSTSGGIAPYSYTIEIYSDAAGANTINELTGIAGESYAWSDANNVNGYTGDLVYNTKYYWSVTVTDASNQTASTGIYGFTTLLATPALSSPADGVQLTTNDPTFTWTMADAKGNVEYELLLGTSPGLASPGDVDNTTAVGPGTLEINPSASLASGQLYYWNINAVVNDGTADNDGEEALATERSFRTPVKLTFPIDTVTDVPVLPTFKWEDVVFTETEYELRISTAGGSQAAFDGAVIFVDDALPADTDSVTYTEATEDDSLAGTFPFPLSNNTVYYWQVTAKDGGSTVISSPIWSFRTLNTSTVTLVTPFDGKTYSSFEPFNPILFDWDVTFPSTGLTYKLQIYEKATAPTKAEWETPTFEYDTTTTFYSASGFKANTKYYWRVVVYNGDDEVVNYSGEYSFTTAAGAVAATLTYPTGGIDTYTNAPTFYWYILGYLTGDISFDLLIDDEATVTAPHVQEHDSISTIYKTLTTDLDPGTTYWWKVITYYKRGTAEEDTAHSAIASFTTQGAGSLVKPVPSYPTGDVTLYTTSPYVYWYLSEFGSGLTYKVYYKTKSAGTYTEATGGTPTSNYFYQLSGLTPGEEYYWYVASFDGTSELDSDIDSFKVASTVTAGYPVASWPVGNPTVYTNQPTLYWYLAGSNLGLTEYHVTWRKDSAPADWEAYHGGSNPKAIVGIDTTFYTVDSVLEAGATYYWAVAGYDGSSHTVFSEGSFTVDAGSGTGTPVVVYPTGGTTVYTIAPSLSWTVTGSTSGISGYQVVYSKTSAFVADTSVTDTVTSASQTVTLSGLTPGATYYWKVRIDYGSSFSSYSSPVGEFVVSAGASSVVPKAGSPTDKITVNANNPMLSWILPVKSESELTYEVQVSESGSFQNSMVYSELDKPAVEVADLKDDTEYFWRVRSKTADGEYSDYSEATSFNTGNNSVVSVGEEDALPNEFAISQNYPNPFNPTTTIQYSIPEASIVSIKIYNILGQEVRSLINKEVNPGAYQVTWKGDDNFGHKVASGTYIYQIRAGSFVQSKKMVLLK